MVNLTPQQLREKYGGQTKSSPSFFDAPVTSKFLSVLRDPEKRGSAVSSIKNAALDAYREYAARNTAEQAQAMQGKTGIRRAGAQLGTQIKQGGRLALGFGREIAAGAATIVKSALPEAPEGAPRIGASPEFQEKVFGREIRRIQDSVVKPTREYAERQGSGALEKFALPLAAGLGAVAMESPVGLPAKKIPAKIFAEIAKDAVESSVERKIISAIPEVKADPEILATSVRLLARETDPKEVARIMDTVQKKALEATARKSTAGSPLEQLSRRAGNSLENNRTGERSGRVDQIVKDMQEGKKVDPIQVRELEDGKLDIIDGRHRLEAARKTGYKLDVENVTKDFNESRTKVSALRKDQPKISDEFSSFEGTVARERFDIPNLEKISFGGSDRDVYDLGDGKALKVVKSSRGLDQNLAASDYYAQDAGLIPKTYEVGDNYVVVEKVNKPDARTKQVVKDIQEAFSERNVLSKPYETPSALNDVSDKYRAAGDDEIADWITEYGNYNLLTNDFTAIRNWGTKENGMPVLIDEGTLDSELVSRNMERTNTGTVKSKKNLENPEFADVYHRSKAAKKRLGDADPKTMYGAVGGFEVDEEEGIKFDPVKAALGLFGMAAYTRVFPNAGGKYLLKNLKKHPDFDRVESEILTEFELAEAGERIITDSGVIAKSSTFPKWIPEHLRKRPLLDAVEKHINDGTTPKKNATAQQELYDTVIDEMAARLTITHIDPLDDVVVKAADNDMIPEELIQQYEDDALAQLAKDDFEINGNISRVDEEGVFLPAKQLDTLNEIPETPKKAALFNIKSDVTPDFEIPEQTRFAYIRQQIQDKMERLGTIQKAVEKNRGEALPDNLDAYLQQELYVGRAAERVDQFRDQIIHNRKSGEKALLERIKNDGIDIEDMGEYLHARHAKERNAKVREINEDIPDGGSGMLDAEADEILKKWEGNDKISAYADEVYEKITKERLKILQESGLMTPDAIETISNSYKNYVPLKVTGKDLAGGGRGKGFSVSGKDVKRVKGSLKDRYNPLIQAIVDYEETVMKAEKNKVAQTMAKLVELNPNKALWEIESLKYAPRFNKDGEVISLDPKYKFADNVMEARFDGKVKLITIHDRELAKAMKNLGSEKAVSKTLLTINNYLRGVNTFYNPEFMITNFERDLQTALINLSGEKSAKLAASVARDTLPAMKGIYKSLKGKKDGVKKAGTDWAALYDEMRAEGGRVGWFDMNDVQSRTDETISLIKKYTSDSTLARSQRMIDGVANLVSDMNESVEMAVRLSTYKNAVESGISKQKAAQLSKNLTVNFNKKGNWGTAMNSLYLFANAGIQGSTRIVQALRHPRTRKIALGIAGFSYGLAELNRHINQEQYDRISDYEKDTNMILMLPDNYQPSDEDVKEGIITGSPETGYYLKLRLPYGYNIFKVIGDVTYNQVHQQKTPAEELKHFMLALDASFNPLSSGTLLQLAAPTIADPVVQNLENLNFFGSPIKPEQNQYAPAQRESSLYFKSAREGSVAVAEWLNDVTGGDEVKAGLIDISPELIDHYIDFIGGGLGKLIANTGETATQLAQGDLPDVQNMPFIRKFVGETDENVEKYDLYDLLDRSATRPLSGLERSRFVDDVEKSLESGQLDADQGKKIIKEFLGNEARLQAGEVFKTVINGSDEEVADAIESLSPAARKELTKLLKKEAEDRLDRAETQGGEAVGTQPK